MSALPTPSNAELELLKALWRQGACSAREVHNGAVYLKPQPSYRFTLLK